jgi:hypothetical protein
MMDDPRFVALVLSGVALAFYLLLIGVVLRLTRQKFAVRVLLICAVVIFGITVTLAHANVAIAYWHFAAFFGCGVAITVFTYGAVLKALSLRMLAVMIDFRGNSATIEGLANDVLRVAFEERIRLLEGKHLVRRIGAAYLLTPSGRLAASRLRRVQQLLNIGPAGFYWD